KSLSLIGLRASRRPEVRTGRRDERNWLGSTAEWTEEHRGDAYARSLRVSRVSGRRPDEPRQEGRGEALLSPGPSPARAGKDDGGDRFDGQGPEARSGQCRGALSPRPHPV